MTAKIVPIASARRRLAAESLRGVSLGREASGRVADSIADLPTEFLLDVEPADLEDFIEADQVHVAADPVFKERLRRELWTMLSARLPGSRGPSGAS